MSEKKSNVNMLRNYITSSISDILEKIVCNDLKEDEKVLLMAQLDILKNVRAICEQRNKY